MAAASDAVLFDLAFEEDIKARASEGRPRVPVDPETLDMLRRAEAEGKRRVFRVRDANHYETMANVLYSAGDILVRSVTPAPGIIDAEGKFQVVKDVKDATHLRVRVGQRRGKKTSASKTDAVAS